MPEITLSVEMNCELKVASLKGFSAQATTIDYSGDIDFTPLVERLLETVSTENTFVLNTVLNDDQDEKENLIIKTISDIIGKYNQVVAAPETE